MTPREYTLMAAIAGGLVGLAGVCVLIGPGVLGDLGGHNLAQLAILGAAVSYAFAGSGRCFRALPPVVAVAGMMRTAALMALPIALAMDRPWALHVGARSWGALLGLALLSTALGFVIYFRVLATAGAANVMLGPCSCRSSRSGSARWSWTSR